MTTDPTPPVPQALPDEEPTAYTESEAWTDDHSEAGDDGELQP